MNLPPSLTDVLWEFPGKCGLLKAQKAVEHIEWLRNELKISRYNESAAYAVLEDERKELRAARVKLVHCANFMLVHDPANYEGLFGRTQRQGDAHEQIARQARGAEGKV